MNITMVVGGIDRHHIYSILPTRVLTILFMGLYMDVKTMFSEAYIKRLRSVFDRDGIFRDLYLDFNMECFVSIDAKVISWVNIEISDELNAGTVKNISHGTIQYLNQ